MDGDYTDVRGPTGTGSRSIGSLRYRYWRGQCGDYDCDARSGSGGPLAGDGHLLCKGGYLDGTYGQGQGTYQ